MLVEERNVVTPREHRFVELAVEQGSLTRADAETIIEYQTQKRSEGETIPLWDSAVLNNVLDAGAAEELREEAGALDIEKLDEFALVRKPGQGGSPERQRWLDRACDFSYALVCRGGHS